MNKTKVLLKDKLVESANRVWEAFRRYGPVDDGRREGEDFDTSLMELRLAAKAGIRQATEERKLLVLLATAYASIKEPVAPELAVLLIRIEEVISYSDIYAEASPV